MTIPLTEAQLHAIQTAEMVNFGSGPSAHAFEYRHSGVNGFNFGMTPSSFLMEKPLLEFVAPMLPRGCAVILTVCPFSFGKNNGDDQPRKRFARYFRLYESAEPADELWFPYGASREESGCGTETLESRTTSMLKIWSKEFDLALTENAPLDVAAVRARNAEAFDIERARLLELHEICRKNGLRSCLLLPPLAKALRERLPNGLLDIFVYENTQKLPQIPVLDYTAGLDDSDFCGPVFLSLNGAVRFTKTIAEEISACPLKPSVLDRPCVL